MVSVVSLVLLFFYDCVVDLKFGVCLVHRYATLLWCHVVIGFNGFLLGCFLCLHFKF